MAIVYTKIGGEVKFSCTGESYNHYQDAISNDRRQVFEDITPYWCRECPSCEMITNDDYPVSWCNKLNGECEDVCRDCCW